MSSVVEDPVADVSVEALVEKLQPQLKRILARYRLPPEDAEDILQQSLLDLVYKRKTLFNPEAWLLATVRNRSIIYWRRRRTRNYEAVDASVLEALAPVEAPSQGQAALRCDLERALERLPPRYQALLKLRYALGYKPAEVADRLGYQASSIRKVTTRCLARLHRQLQATGYRRK
jgi:RNA polymerase sigma-70 factor (ECF subfamily)